MWYDLNRLPKVLAIYLKLSEYPILSREVRERMRQEIFARGVITQEQFAQEVKAKAITTQVKEGLADKLGQEPHEEWAERLRIVRDHLTDFYFALNLPHDLFEEIFRETLGERQPEEDIVLTFNAELAPWQMLFAQAEEYESLAPDKKAAVRHHLQQIIVVIIRGMISDQLGFVGVAREYFDIGDLRDIFNRRIGRGKVGGKAAGMMLAYKILHKAISEGSLASETRIAIPDSYFIGADVYYDFMEHNKLYGYLNQKYKLRDEIEADYPEICQRFLQGDFPPGIATRLASVIAEVEDSPLIVRSSSLLEDNFGKSFAGKYESVFCPNQGSPEEKLEGLLDAVRRVYASTLNPDALFYRRQVGLLDYDERMAVLVQRVQGSQYGQYFFPAVAGVAFGRNPLRWSQRIRHQDGFMRIVWGLGTRAVERVGRDYPRMVALSHPQIRPEISAGDIRRYSQQYVDVIDLEENRFETLAVNQIIGGDYPGIELLASLDEGEYIHPLHFRRFDLPPNKLVLTFDRLLGEDSFIASIKGALQRLEAAYGCPVDTEFTVEIREEDGVPRFILHLLQCRPLSLWNEENVRRIPQDIPESDVVFTSAKMVPDGIVSQIEYVVYVDGARYGRISDLVTKLEIGRVVGRLNEALEGHRFILVGPGRWGSSNIDLGVRVSYADIYNTKALVEVAFSDPGGGTPELSYGTHFFQDLVETNIYPLSVFPDREDTVFERSFFEDAPNCLEAFLPDDAAYAEFVTVVDVQAVSGGRLLELVMSAEEEKAVAYLCDDARKAVQS